MLINLRNALMTGKRLPYDAEVEYLESTGTQWIDTGVDAALCNSAIMKTECAFSVTGRGGPGGNYNGVFGAAVPRFGVYTISNNLSWGYGQSHDNVKTFTYGDWIESTCVFTKDNQTATFDGSSFTATSGLTLNSRTIGVFCRNATPVQWLALAKIRYLRIYVDSILVRDFIPVRKGTVGYLYDRVSGKLFGNAGTGDFVLGPDVVPVEYIESHGTEWIDTGITPSAATECNIDLMFTGTATQQFGTGRASSSEWAVLLGYYQNRIAFWAGVNQATRLGTHTVNERVMCGFSIPNGTYWLGGNPTADTNLTAPTTNCQAFALFARKNTTNSFSGFCTMRAYSADINGVEGARKMLPVRVGTEGAMMDALTRRIYRNSGTGAFTYGNDLKYPIPA